MTFYIQYNEDGTISATVSSDTGAPIFSRQIALSDYVDTTNKIIDLSDPANPALIDNPIQ